MNVNNKHLINASRYLEAMYEIPIDEKAHNLPFLIETIKKGMDMPQLNEYWHKYLLDTDTEYHAQFIIEEIKKKDKLKAEKTKDVSGIYYRGSKQDVETAPKVSPAIDEKEIYYRGVKQENSSLNSEDEVVSSQKSDDDVARENRKKAMSAVKKLLDKVSDNQAQKASDESNKGKKKVVYRGKVTYL